MTTVQSIATAMFTVSSQDEAITFYRDTLGWEVRTDVTFGEGDEQGRWVEVAPRGSHAVLALNEFQGGVPGGGAIGVESTDVRAEREALAAAGVTVGEIMGGEGAVPLMFSASDRDGNNIWVVAVSTS
ncbi:glyoxalase [Nocardioides baekrokdamisoli]|uniref:Glyoxalase n=1 Tax=Nocardioides baekrokdamisoli TaxID=1804624 RepID=A0A3G9IY77_9ACTN|nr:VOC family protein [Nocardioides baekrokdamisoli]BBH18631.1 glyoxalase [Nocardioides baekrokdamisoli]